MANQFRKKPVVIEAVQFVAENEAVMLAHLDGCTGWHMQGGDGKGIIIPTLEGEMVAQPGDWIIKGVKGEFYPCKPDIFAATYEAAGAPFAPPAAGEGETLASRIEDALDWAVRAGVDRQTLVERLRIELAADRAAAPRERADPSIEARPESEWHEDDGAALWWKFPVVEPPYVGSPLDDDFPDYVTHWTRIAVPTAPSASTSNAITMAMLCLGNRPGATTRREVVETEERADG